MSTSTRERSARRAGRYLAAALAISLAVPGLAASADPATAATVAESDRYAPSPVPDRITLTPASDPTTAQIVTWRTSTDVAQPVVEYRTMTPEPYPGGVAQVAASTSTEQATDLGYSHAVHTAELTELDPGTDYMYRVGDGTNFSEWQDFSTATSEASDFSVIYLGDIQNGIRSQASRVVRNAFRDRPDADVVLQIGDLVNDAESDAQWGELYDAFSYTLGTQQMLTTPGNHEYEGGELSQQWSDLFVYPDNGPQGTGAIYDALDGTVYFSDYQGVRFISLNSNIAGDEALTIQAEWLDGVLADNPNEWTIVYFHHPAFSLDEGRNNLRQRDIWVPVLEEYDVDLVLQGHDHAYGRGNTLASEENPGDGWDSETDYSGPVYVGSTVGEKFYTPGPRHWLENDARLRRMAAGTQLYQLIDISANELRYEARTADGEYFDGLTITKDGDGKRVSDDEPPQEIDPDDDVPCLGCEDNPDQDPDDPDDPDDPQGDFSYEVIASLSSVNNTNAALPAGLAFSDDRDVLYLGDQNGRKIFEIDPETDEITREMTLPENIRDLGIDEDNELLYVGQQNRNWVVVSIADDNFGEVVRGPYPIIESNRSIDVDPVNGLVYAAVPARGVEVFDAETGSSLGVIGGTADAYYVAADPATGTVVSTKFYSSSEVMSLQAHDATNGFSLMWEKAVRPGPRQVDIDSVRGLLYVGYTGTSEGRGGFSVHNLATGTPLGDFADPTYGKDGYGITVDEEHQRVFVANRDFRLNPPGEETDPVSVTVSRRIIDGTEDPDDPDDGEDPDEDPDDPDDPDDGKAYTARSLSVIPSATDVPESDARPVGSDVEKATGHLFVANEMRPARVWEIDPASDTIVAEHEVPAPDAISEGVRDVALDEAANELYVAYSNKWLVMDADTAELVRGPFGFSANVRGLDVDLELGRVYGATRGSGFDVMDAETGEVVEIVETPGSGWRSHGIAVDPATSLVYVSNADADGGTDGVRIYDADLNLTSSIPLADADLRQIEVDSSNKLIIAGHSTTMYEESGVSVYSAEDLSLLHRLKAHEYGNKVYGVSVNAETGQIYVSARDRYPAGLIELTPAGGLESTAGE